MDLKHAKNLISSWNGKDSYFLHDGEIYTEDDVQDAHAFMEGHYKNKKEINYKLAALSIIGIIACIVTALILN